MREGVSGRKQPQVIMVEVKQKSVSVFKVSENEVFPFKRFSSLARLKRVLAFSFLSI